MVNNKALDYLKSLEYSMGNGQCPDCFGVPPSWHGHPCHPTPESIGHSADCPLATAIVNSGGQVIFKNSLSSLPLGPRYKKGSALYKYYNSKEFKAWEKGMREKLDEIMFNILTKKKQDGR